MPDYPFEYDLNVYVIGDDHYESAYYTYQKKAYRRRRKVAKQTWQDTTPVEIDKAEFWMVVACIDMMREHRWER